MPQNHKKYPYPRKKLHQVGVGSLMPGKKFLIFDKKKLRNPSIDYSYDQRLHWEKVSMFYILKDDINEYDLQQYANKLK